MPFAWLKIIPCTFSPADRGRYTYHMYRGAISFWSYLVPLRLAVSIFLNVGRVEISCWLLTTRTFLYDITIKLCYCEKR